jgi:NAD(P)-dependent dehydrogenase (short-subunit alcohol dehydrogenase family)
MDLGLSGKRALVTGSSRGIGRAIAHTLAGEGACVAVCARHADQVEQAAHELRQATGAEVVGFVGDTATRDGVVGLVEAVAAKIGSVDILVNNAATPGGRLKGSNLGGVTRDDLLAEVDVKVLGYLFAAQAVVPAMKEKGFGRIINVAGLGARMTGSIVGSIRNVAVAAMTKNLGDELGQHGITVNCIHPGVTARTSSPIPPVGETPAVQAASTTEPLMNSIRRVIHDVDLAPLVAFLASPLSFPINGEMIECFGGLPGTIRY